MKRPLAFLALLCFAPALFAFTSACTAQQCQTIAQSGMAGALAMVGAQLIAGAVHAPDPCGAGAPASGTSSAQVTFALKGQPASMLQASGGVCAPDANDAPCVACNKAHCCQESVVGCLLETTCQCLIACQANGTDLSDCAGADNCTAGPDATYDTAAACIADHCASECAELHLQ